MFNRQHGSWILLFDFDLELHDLELVLYFVALLMSPVIGCLVLYVCLPVVHTINH